MNPPPSEPPGATGDPQTLPPGEPGADTTAPATIPCISRFCTIRKKATTGTVNMTLAAMTPPQSV